MAGVIVAAIVGNLDFWIETFGGGAPIEGLEEEDEVKDESAGVGEPAVSTDDDSAAGDTVATAGAANEFLAEPVTTRDAHGASAGGDPVRTGDPGPDVAASENDTAGSVDQEPEQPGQGAPRDDAFSRLARMFADDGMRSGGPRPEEMRRWLHAAEPVSGMTMKELMTAAYEMRKKRSRSGHSGEGGDDEGGAEEGASSVRRAAAEAAAKAAVEARSALMTASLDTVIAAGQWSVCRLGGHRLRVGETYPGTGFKVTEIGKRTVTLSDGEDTIVKGLSNVRTVEGADGEEEDSTAGSDQREQG